MPLALRPGNEAWPVAVEAMLEIFFSSLVCCSTVNQDAVQYETRPECHRHQRHLTICTSCCCFPTCGAVASMLNMQGSQYSDDLCLFRMAKQC